MNRKVRKASQALNAAREAYEKAAKDLLAAVEATPAEMEAAGQNYLRRLHTKHSEFSL